MWSASGYEKPTFEAGVRGLRSAEARPFLVGDRLGPSWTNHWLQVVLRIPKHWAVGDDAVICEPAAGLLRMLTGQSSLIRIVKASSTPPRGTPYMVSVRLLSLCRMLTKQRLPEGRIRVRMGSLAWQRIGASNL